GGAGGGVRRVSAGGGGRAEIGGAGRAGIASAAASRGCCVEKILITGANGHLGANLLRRVLADGAAVRVLLRPGSDNTPVDGLDVERHYGDLRDADAVAAATAGCGAIYHCAAQISTASGGEHDIFATNVLGTRNLLRAALANGARRAGVSP